MKPMRLTIPEGDERIVRVFPGYHKRPEGSRHCSIYGGAIMFVLARPLLGKAISWELLTDWGLTPEAFKAAVPDCTHPSHQDGYPQMGRHNDRGTGAMGSAVVWHYTNDQGSECNILGGRCTGDAGFLLGDTAFEILRDQGDEALWKWLGELLDEDHDIDYDAR